MTFSESIFVELMIVQQHYLATFYTEFHQYRSRGMEITDTSSFTPLRKFFAEPIFTKLTFAPQCFVENTCTEFRRNLTAGLVADAGSRTEAVST